MAWSGRFGILWARAWPDDNVPDGGGDDESDNKGEGIGNEVLQCWPSFENIDVGGVLNTL
jgi:hypothetical protein